MPEFVPVEGLANLTTGVYQIKAGEGNGASSFHAAVSGRYLTKSTPSTASGRGNYVFEFKDAESAAQDVASTYFIVKRTNNDITIQSFSDQTLYIQSDGTKGTNAASLAVTVPTAGKPSQFKVGGTLMAWTFNSGSNYYLGKSSTGGGDARFQFSKVCGISVYGATGNNARLNFTLPTSVENFPSRSTITPATIDGYKSYVTFDQTSKEFGIHYIYGAALTEGAVGAPTSDKLSAINSAFTAYEASQTEETANAITAALDAAPTMPEDGGVYRIYGLLNDGTRLYLALNDAGNGLRTVSVAQGGTNVPSDLWVVQKNGNDYYLAHQGGSCYTDIKADRQGSPIALSVSKMREKAGCLSITGIEENYIVYKALANNGSLNKFTDRTVDNTGAYYGTFTAREIKYTTDVVFEKVENFTPLTARTVAGTSSSQSLALGTINLPYAVSLPEGVTANSVTDNGTSIRLTPLTLESNVLPANTPVVLQTAEANDAISLNPAPYAARIETNLEGTLWSADIPEGSYIFSKYDTGNAQSDFAFFLINPDSRTIGANKAYLAATSSAAASIRIDAGNGTTGIDTIETEANSNNAVYDLSGRRVENPAKGIYIKNGKKVYIK